MHICKFLYREIGIDDRLQDGCCSETIT